MKREKKKKVKVISADRESQLPVGRGEFKPGTMRELLQGLEQGCWLVSGPLNDALGYSQ